MDLGLDPGGGVLGRRMARSTLSRRRCARHRVDRQGDAKSAIGGGDPRESWRAHRASYHDQPALVEPRRRGTAARKAEAQTWSRETNLVTNMSGLSYDRDQRSAFTRVVVVDVGGAQVVGHAGCFSEAAGDGAATLR